MYINRTRKDYNFISNQYWLKVGGKTLKELGLETCLKELGFENTPNRNGLRTVYKMVSGTRNCSAQSYLLIYQLSSSYQTSFFLIRDLLQKPDFKYK